MSATTWLTRGGQLALHRVRMISQVVSVLFILSLCSSLGYGVWSLYKMVPSPYWKSAQAYWKAKFLLEISLSPPHTVTQEIQKGAHTYSVRSLDVLHHPRIVRETLWVQKTLKKAFWRAIWIFFWTFGLGSLFFVMRGYRHSRKIEERGKSMISPRKLTWLLKIKRKASDLNLDGVPLLKYKETQHILITGTTGSGKSNCLKTLLSQIRKRPNRALIVDLTGELVHRYYRAGHDLILNPFDNRTHHWSPWADCSHETHFDTLAQALVPSMPQVEPFWREAGKEVLAAALRKMKETQKIDELYHILVLASLGEFCRYFIGTEAAAYTHPDGEKMTLSIRATLANQIQSFKYLKEGNFSFRNWVQQEDKKDQWLFLTALPDQRATLIPLIRGQMDTALNALMSLDPNPQRRLWFVLDELPALQKLPSLKPTLAEGRKYGACVLAGVQSFPQLTEEYGVHGSQSLLDLFNTKIFFRSDNPQTTQWISQVLGEKEVEFMQESLSYGANTIRDGISLSRNKKRDPLVLPTEIANLNDLEAYLKLPGNWPITKFKMRYQADPL